MTRKYSLPFLVAFLAFEVLCDSNISRAQANDPGDRQAIQALRDSIKNDNFELNLLQHFLESSTVDSRILRHSDVKAWIISSPALHDSLFYALMEADSSIQSEAGADAEVLATKTNDLIQVRFGTAVFKGLTLKDALAKSSDPDLYRKVAESYRYSRDVELRDPSYRLPTDYDPEPIPYKRLLEDFTPLTLSGNPHPVYARIHASLYDIAFRVGPKWGGEIRLGLDEINQPFWSLGSAGFLVSYEQVKFGFVLPFPGGRNTSYVFPPFVIRGRKLNGTRGIMGEFDLGAVGGLFSITRLTTSDLSHLTDPTQAPYIPAVLTLYYSFGLSLNSSNYVRTKVGFGVHRLEVANITQVPDPSGNGFETSITRQQNHYISPYLKFEYLNKDITDRFTASVQFYDLTLLLTGSMELVPDLLSIEAKYVWPIAPSLREWQNPDFFIISPRLRWTF